MINIDMKKTIGASIATTVLGMSAAYADFPESFADLAEEVSPSVVRITTTTSVGGNSLRGFPNQDQLPEFFRDFFGQMPEFQDQPREQQGLGSGFIVKDGKFIVTNEHVIKGASNIVVETIGGEIVEAELVGVDVDTDIAVLEVMSDLDLTDVEFGDSDEARVGDWVMAVGNPLGQDFTVTTGIISARHRSLDGGFDDYLQTDAAINRGNSGGPLFNMDGEVIGVNTAILSPNGGSIGLGFSMSSNVVEGIVDQIIEFGEARRGWLGVGIDDLDETRAEALGLNSTDGVIVASVSADSPAEKAGLQLGDVILKFNGQAVTDAGALVKAVGGSEIDSEVPIEIYRQQNDENITLTVKLGKRPQNPQLAQNTEEPADAGEAVLGMTIAPLNQETAEALGYEKPFGLLIREVEQGAVAARRGLRPGDIISEVNQTPINSVDEFKASIDDAKSRGRDAILMLVHRENQAIFVAVPLQE